MERGRTHEGQGTLYCTCLVLVCIPPLFITNWGLWVTTNGEDGIGDDRGWKGSTGSTDGGDDQKQMGILRERNCNLERRCGLDKEGGKEGNERRGK